MHEMKNLKICMSAFVLRPMPAERSAHLTSDASRGL